MTVGTRPRAASAAAGPSPSPARGTTSRGLVVSLAVAVAATVALVVIGPAAGPAPPPPGRVNVATAWPEVRRADFDPALPDGPLFTPVLFLDPATAIGTAPTPDARWVRLLLRAGTGEPRELRRLPLGEEPQFEAVTALGDDLVWTESTAGRPQVRIWHARRSGGPARLLTADTGNALFYGNQDDLVIADGRVHWAAAPPPPSRRGDQLRRRTAPTSVAPSPRDDRPPTRTAPTASLPSPRNDQPPPRTAPTPSWAGPSEPGGYDNFSPSSTAGAVARTTEVRSVSLGGGAVAVRTEPGGEWALSAWPWLYDEQEGRLRNLATGRDREVVTRGPETATCSPVWCRVMVMSGDGLARIDLMHPDGSGRRRIAGAAAQAAVADVGVLDRFEVLSEAGPGSDLTGTAGLLVYDVATGRTVDVAGGVDGAFTGGGMLWWSTTAEDDTITWHALDLRTA